MHPDKRERKLQASRLFESGKRVTDNQFSSVLLILSSTMFVPFKNVLLFVFIMAMSLFVVHSGNIGCGELF